MFGVTQSDIAALDETEFSEVWAALGKVARPKGAQANASGTAVRAVSNFGNRVRTANAAPIRKRSNDALVVIRGANDSDWS
jgi:hypothetical protein